MAQFLKVEAVSQPQSLIPIDQISGITCTSDGTDSTLVITLQNVTEVWTIIVADPDGGVNAMIETFNKAIVANPGGVVSTVVPPLTTAQAPAESRARGKKAAMKANAKKDKKEGRHTGTMVKVRTSTGKIIEVDSRSQAARDLPRA